MFVWGDRRLQAPILTASTIPHSAPRLLLLEENAGSCERWEVGELTAVLAVVSCLVFIMIITIVSTV